MYGVDKIFIMKELDKLIVVLNESQHSNPSRNAETCDVGRGNEKEVFLLFRVKVLNKFTFPMLAEAAY
jgi:hypothetical protein